ncbi:MAG: YqgE/AlgH family protein [Flavobacteriales bacterium]|nr:YqgE/AlgH family protein [Flavobacteriales bacterium]MCB9168025.1 YqgE/AlgH family protein [Flavobacteriales bacterium]
MSHDPLDLDPDNRLPPKRGRLLVSEPFLSDPYFRRTVVLLCEHNDEGSFGLVLNRFLDIEIGDLMEDMPPIRSRVSIGGPVQSGNLYYLHTFGRRVEGSVPVVDGVHMGGDIEQLRAILKADPKLARHVRFFVGYSGWSEEQLARELEERSWLIGPANKRRIMRTEIEDIWGETLRSMGRTFAPLANFPEDPSLN